MSDQVPAGTSAQFGQGAGEAEIMAAMGVLKKIMWLGSDSDYPVATKKQAITAYKALERLAMTLYPYRFGTL